MNSALAILGAVVMFWLIVGSFRVAHAISIIKGGPDKVWWCLACPVDHAVHVLLCHWIHVIKCADSGCSKTEV